MRGKLRAVTATGRRSITITWHQMAPGLPECAAELEALQAANWQLKGIIAAIVVIVVAGMAVREIFDEKERAGEQDNLLRLAYERDQLAAALQAKSEEVAS